MKDIHIRAFKAVDDREASMKYVEGHKRVLENVGVNEVTSSNYDWVNNPSVYVILIESGDRTKIYGGSRIHIADGKTPLPLEEATKDLDVKVSELVKNNMDQGTSEICGLWNSLEVAGYGIGSIYAIRSAISILPSINCKSAFALCSPYTAGLVNRNYGSLVEKSVGNDGTFYYPKIDLLATIVLLKDAIKLDGASDMEKSIIASLRENPSQENEEVGRKGEVHVTYKLKL